MLEAAAPGPKFLYLHGFASGPGSKKGTAVAARLNALGLEVERLDLRVPSMERLSFGSMMDVTRRAIGGPRDRAVLIGSSLGGLVAARVAEADPRVCALVLLAPAFRFIERWRARLGERGWRKWTEDEWLEVPDHATRGLTRIPHSFAREAAELDAGNSGWPDVRVPTLIIHGVRDDVVPIGLSREFAEQRHHVRVVELEDGHELLVGLPVLLAEIEAFLGWAIRR